MPWMKSPQADVHSVFYSEIAQQKHYMEIEVRFFLRILLISLIQ